jgi:hypothetical protein
MKSKVKDASKKKIVELYQRQIEEAITNIRNQEGKLSSTKKDYIKVLEENIKRAPYVLGYLEWPETKKKK